MFPTLLYFYPAHCLSAPSFFTSLPACVFMEAIGKYTRSRLIISQPAFLLCGPHCSSLNLSRSPPLENSHLFGRHSPAALSSSQLCGSHVWLRTLGHAEASQGFICRCGWVVISSTYSHDNDSNNCINNCSEFRLFQKDSQNQTGWFVSGFILHIWATLYRVFSFCQMKEGIGSPLNSEWNGWKWKDRKHF